MKKIVKIVTGIVAFVVVLALAGGVILGLFIDPNDYKNEIRQSALDKAGINLAINGSIGWSVFPWIGLEISDIEVNYPERPALAKLAQAQLSVKLAPLFSGVVEMQTITIAGLELNLEKAKDGSVNWQRPISTEAKPKTVEPTSPSKPSDNDGSSIHIDIQSIVLSNAKINYSDKISGANSQIDSLNLTTDRVVLGQPFNAKLSFNATSKQGNKQLVVAQVETSANFLLDLDAQRYEIKQLDGQFAITTDQRFEIKLLADIDADLKAGNASIQNIKLSALNTQTSGDIAISNFTNPQINGQLNVANFDLKALMQQLKLAPISTADDAALRKISLKTKLSGSLAKLDLHDLVLQLDDTAISGIASYGLLNGLIGFDLKGNKIDLNRYLAPKAANASSSATSNSASSTGSSTNNQSAAYSKEQIIALRPLQDLKLKGQLSLAQVIYEKTILSNILVKVDANKGLIKIPNLNASLYGGQLNNALVIDARKKPLSISIQNQASDIQLGSVLQDFAQLDVLTGTLNSSSKLKTYGQSVHSIVNSISGQSKFVLSNGVIKGIDAAQKMCETINSISSLGGVAGTTRAVDQSTPFANIGGSFKLNKGIVSNQDFKAKLDALNIGGRGSVNLPQQSLDYRLGLNIEDNLFKKSCSVNNKIQGIEWPIDCKGNFSDDPLTLCKPDLGVVEDILKAKFNAKIDAKKAELKKKIEAKKQELQQKVEDKVKDKIEDKAKNLLKGLF